MKQDNNQLDRRGFLKLAAATGAVSVAGSHLGASGADTATPGKMAKMASPGASTGPTPSSSVTTAHAIQPVKDNGRLLVVIELQGGNDGLSTLVPQRDPAYRKLRSRTLIEPAQALRLNDDFGLHPKLARLQKRGTAVIAGVGTPNPDGSHFAMMRRWWLGDPTGTASPAAGFFGRCCDVIGDPEAPAVGLSVNSGPTMALTSTRVSTLSLPDLGALDLFRSSTDDPQLAAFQHAYRALANRPGPAAAGMRRAMSVARSLQRVSGDHAIPETKVEYPGSSLSDPLRAAARTMAADVGVRVLHVTLGGFDTHSNHVDTHAGLMDQLDGSIDAFLTDIEQRGFGDRVVVATISEFGRRAADNGSNGLDHGAASVALIAGKAVNPGVHGEPASLTKLDVDGNLRATTCMERYYATLAQWLGIPPGEVLAGDPKPLEGVFR